MYVPHSFLSRMSHFLLFFIATFFFTNIKYYYVRGFLVSYSKQLFAFRRSSFYCSSWSSGLWITMTEGRLHCSWLELARVAMDDGWCVYAMRVSYCVDATKMCVIVCLIEFQSPIIMLKPINLLWPDIHWHKSGWRFIWSYALAWTGSYMDAVR